MGMGHLESFIRYKLIMRKGITCLFAQSLMLYIYSHLLLSAYNWGEKLLLS